MLELPDARAASDEHGTWQGRDHAKRASLPLGKESRAWPTCSICVYVVLLGARLALAGRRRAAQGQVSRGLGARSSWACVPAPRFAGAVRLAARRQRGRSQPDRARWSPRSAAGIPIGTSSISTTTLTGYALATHALCRSTPVFYCPLDFSWAVRRAVRAHSARRCWCWPSWNCGPT